MDNRGDILQLCRLCLVKDDVNIPIFEEQGDIRQIFLKISSCLPVKVDREDKLPKKICDGCSYKLDMFYDFWNSTANAEKQLMTWLGEAGMTSKMTDGTIAAVTQQAKPNETVVKQEELDPSDIHTEENDDKSYMFHQKFSEDEPGPSATTINDEPPPKRARRTAAVKAQIAMDPESDDDEDSGEPLTKVEDESEESEGEDHDPNFVDVPSTSADDQPGPSGVGKDGDAPTYDCTLSSQEAEEEEILITFVDDDECSEYIKLEEYGDIENFTFIEDKNEPKQMKSSIILQPLQDKNKYIHETKETEELLENEFLDEINESLIFSVDQSVSKGKKSIENKSTEHVLCAVCGKLVRARAMTAHLRSHAATGYQCKVCDLTFKTLQEFNKHKESHTNNEYPCQFCDLSFKTATEYALHGFKHTNNYSCSICNFVTKSKGSICGHIKRHEGRYEYYCDICGKGFIGKALLASHEEIHLDIKRYICEVCGKKFTVRRYLEVHRQLNHKKELYGFEELFKCDICEREFTFEKSLIRHRSVIHQIGENRSVECKVCHKTIANNYNLKLHMRTHTGEKNYCCDLCGKAFSAYKYWKKHKLTHERKLRQEDLKEDEEEENEKIIKFYEYDSSS